MATLSTTQQVAYDRALARAKAERIYVRRLSLSSLGSYIVTNPTNKTQYLVTTRGNLLSCSCPDDQNRGGAEYCCKHRAAVREHLIAKYRRADAARAKPTADAFRLNWLGMSRDERAAWLIEQGV